MLFSSSSQTYFHFLSRWPTKSRPPVFPRHPIPPVALHPLPSPSRVSVPECPPHGRHSSREHSCLAPRIQSCQQTRNGLGRGTWRGASWDIWDSYMNIPDGRNTPPPPRWHGFCFFIHQRGPQRGSCTQCLPSLSRMGRAAHNKESVIHSVTGPRKWNARGTALQRNIQYCGSCAWAEVSRMLVMGNHVTSI